MSEETRALTTTKQAVTPDTWRMIEVIANSAYASRKWGAGSAADAAMKMLTGVERGLPLTTSLQCVYMVNNRPAIQPKAAWGLIVGHPDFDATGYKEERLTDASGKFTGYAITLKRKSGLSARRQFTMEDAQRAGLTTKDNWKNYPENCCYWRAMGFAEDAAFPDVLMGLYRADELGASITPDGDVIEGSWSVVQPAPSASAPTPEPFDFNVLMARFSPDAIMAASQEVCGKAMPATDDEWRQVAEKLEAQSNG